MNADEALAKTFLAAHPTNAAPLLEQANAAERVALLRDSPPAVIAAILQRITPSTASPVLTGLTPALAVNVLRELPLGGAALILRSMDAADRDSILQAAPPETAGELRTVLSHSEGSAGSMMDANVLALSVDISVGEARRRSRRRSKRAGNYLYVVDAGRRLVGVVSISELMHASPSTPLESLMSTEVVRLTTGTGAAAILNHAGWREFHALPVVDSEGVLMGVLRRETYERLREEQHERGDRNLGGPGLAIVELGWSAMRSTLDELAQAMSPKRPEQPEVLDDERS